MFLLGRLALLGWAAAALAGCGGPLLETGGPDARANSAQGRLLPGFVELAAAEDGASDADRLALGTTESPQDAPAAVADRKAAKEAFEEITIMRGRSIEVIRVPVVRDVPVEPEPALTDRDCRSDDRLEGTTTACPDPSRRSLESLPAEPPVAATAPPAETPDAADKEQSAADTVTATAPAFAEAETLSEVAVPDDVSDAQTAEEAAAATPDAEPAAIALGAAAPLSEVAVSDDVSDAPTAEEAAAATPDAEPAAIALGATAPLSEVAVSDDVSDAPTAEEAAAATPDAEPAAIALGAAAPLSEGALPDEAVGAPNAAPAGAGTGEAGSVTIPLAAPLGESATPDHAGTGPVDQGTSGATKEAVPSGPAPLADLQEARLAPETLTTKTPAGSVTDDVDQNPVVGTYIVFFDSGTADLNDGAREILAEVVRAARKTAFSAIRASGHSDPMGSEDYNEWLSEQRTLAVVDFLIASGLDKQRIVTESYGSTDPLIPAAGDLAQMQNRRVEIQFLQ